MSFSIVYSTAANAKESDRIAEALIKNKLAACINAFPINSTYRWEGKVCNEKEVALIIKTKKEKVDRVIEKIKKIHNYDVPCIISWDIKKGNKDFLKWMGREII